MDMVQAWILKKELLSNQRVATIAPTILLFDGTKLSRLHLMAMENVDYPHIYECDKWNDTSE